MAFLSLLKKRLSRTRESLIGGLARAIRGRGILDKDLWDRMEEILIRGDVGVETTLKLLDGLKHELRGLPQPDTEDILRLLQKQILEILLDGPSQPPAPPVPERPRVILVVGVNGTGKTTSIAKLTKMYLDEGKTVLLAGCDTFRAAAVEQLEVWAERLGVDMVKNQPGSDPAAVAYDALQAARARDMDILIIDTAGRLHTKRNLMEELRKIKRVISKQIQNGPHETLLVLDATVGQNAISQARLFHQDVGISGILLAKLDGTAKGGIVIAIKDRLHIPVSYIGIGESLEDLERFDAHQFVGALFSETAVSEG
jgi:fused signal recognition particle receptor